METLEIIYCTHKHKEKSRHELNASKEWTKGITRFSCGIKVLVPVAPNPQ